MTLYFGADTSLFFVLFLNLCYWRQWVIGRFAHVSDPNVVNSSVKFAVLKVLGDPVHSGSYEPNVAAAALQQLCSGLLNTCTQSKWQLLTSEHWHNRARCVLTLSVLVVTQSYNIPCKQGIQFWFVCSFVRLSRFFVHPVRKTGVHSVNNHSANFELISSVIAINFSSCTEVTQLCALSSNGQSFITSFKFFSQFNNFLKWLFYTTYLEGALRVFAACSILL